MIKTLYPLPGVKMSDEINYTNNPLHGVGLETLLTELVDHYGFKILNAYLNFKCFSSNPSIKSSVKFLKKTDWAREKVEAFYMYQFKNLPRASSQQFLLPPRDRVVPNFQKPGEPKELSLEDAEQLRQKREKKAAERAQGRREQSNRRSDTPQGRRSNDRNRNRSQRDDRGRSMDRDKVLNFSETVAEAIEVTTSMKEKELKAMQGDTSGKISDEKKEKFQSYSNALSDDVSSYKRLVNSQLAQAIETFQDREVLIGEAIRYESINLAEAYDELCDLQKELQQDINKFI